ncbi:MAG: hypothetical protein AMJ79_13720 [Phycisphaerae bacterium SM23_30]|nr:MAG: hypothetical protein AMJ79_13720 [Phycisphaerae bacterium SM23_30]
MDGNLYLIICCIIALGALGLFLMLPRFGRVGFPRFGALLAAVALVGLFAALLISARAPREAEHFWFTLFGAVAVISAFLMICQKQALYAALYFVLTALAVAGLVLLQKGEFLALALVIVYSGGIIVIYIFALMLARQQELDECDIDARSPFLAVLIGFFLSGSILRLLIPSADNIAQDADVLVGTGTAAKLGAELFNNHVVALEVAGVVLLVAAVAAIAVLKAPKVKEPEERRNLF